VGGHRYLGYPFPVDPVIQPCLALPQKHEHRPAQHTPTW
jgi:hypothetical protein